MNVSDLYEEMVKLVESASERYGNKYELSKEKYSHLKDVCDTITTLTNDEGECKRTAYVDDETKQLVISSVCTSIEFYEKKRTDFMRILQYVDEVEMAATPDICQHTTLYINNLWTEVG